MSRTVYVPRDSAARSVGADGVATAVGAAAGDDVRIVRTGSRGLLSLEPLVEVAVDDGPRYAFGPVAPKDVAGLLEAGLLDADPADPASALATHPLALGETGRLEWLASQNRLTFARVGVVDPLSADDYVAHGGLAGLRTALTMTPAEVVAEVTASGYSLRT